MSNGPKDSSVLKQLSKDLFIQIVILAVTAAIPSPLGLIVGEQNRILALGLGGLFEVMYLQFARPTVDLDYQFGHPEPEARKIRLIAGVPQARSRDAWITVRVRSRTWLGHAVLRNLAREKGKFAFVLTWDPPEFVRIVPQQVGAGMKPMSSRIEFNPLREISYGEPDATFMYGIRVAVGKRTAKTSGYLLVGLRRTSRRVRVLVRLCKKNLPSCAVEIIYP